MIRFLFVLVFSLITVTAHAGQVLMSCDFSGYDGIDTIQIIKTSEGNLVEIYLVGDNKTRYALPFEGEVGEEVDLAGFNYFNDFINPRLVETDDEWFFVTEEDLSQMSVNQVVDCTFLE